MRVEDDSDNLLCLVTVLQFTKCFQICYHMWASQWPGEVSMRGIVSSSEKKEELRLIDKTKQ